MARKPGESRRGSQGVKEMHNLTVASCFALAIAAMLALAPAKAEDMLKSNGKCWVDYAWTDCPREQSTRAKGSKASVTRPTQSPRAAAGTGASSEGGGGRY
jgi:hypothetical protein